MQKDAALSTVYVKSAVPAIPSDAARVVTAAASVASLYFRTFSQPAAPPAPRARASAAAPAAVERADETLLYARLGLPIVVGDIKPIYVIYRSRDNVILI